MAELKPETAFYSIRKLAEGLRDGTFTSMELTQFFLDRVERLGPKLNAVVTITRNLALEQAEQADRKLADGIDGGLLLGIPYGAKDLLAVRGYRTTYGAKPFQDQFIDDDAEAVRRLRDNGAVLIAKLAMVEIAGGLGYRQSNASFTGPGCNPWNPERWSGGSSSGSGSAVGGGLVPFALGTETWGSIMTPAGFCGISGLRPTYGRVSRRGAMALSWTMDKIGPMCRTADDCGLVLNAIAGRDSADESTSRIPYGYPPEEKPPEKFRLATLKGVADQVQPEVRVNYEASLKVLEKFATFEEVEMDDLPWTTVAATFINCEAAAAWEGLLTTGDIWEMTAEEDHWGIHSSMLIPAKDYINAMRIRAKLQRAMDELLAKFDAIVTPTLATVAYPNDRLWSEYRKGFRSTPLVELGGAGNACGLPAISVPNGFGESELPTGLQFVGRAFEENRILHIASRYQQETDWHQKHPTL